MVLGPCERVIQDQKGGENRVRTTDLDPLGWFLLR